jgi:hypothetical protein
MEQSIQRSCALCAHTTWMQNRSLQPIKNKKMLNIEQIKKIMTNREKQLLKEVNELTRNFKDNRVDDNSKQIKHAKFLNFSLIDPSELNPNSILFESLDECIKIISVNLSANSIENFKNNMKEESKSFDDKRVRLVILKE